MDEYLFLGQFEQESDTMVVSDPGYETPSEDGLGCIINNAKIGSWNTWVRMDIKTNRCAELVAIYCNENIEDNPDLIKYDDDKYEWLHIGNIGVDSGQAGIYDMDYYGDNDMAKQYNMPTADFGDNKWYNMNCYVTMNGNRVGIVPHGVVSSSGWGDGLYDIFSITVNDKTNGIKIVFMDSNASDSDSLDDGYDSNS